MLPRLSHALLCTLVLFAVAASLPAQSSGVDPLTLRSQDNPAPAYSPINFTATLRISPVPSGSFALTIGSMTPVAMDPNRSGSAAEYTANNLAAGTYTVTVTFIPSSGGPTYTASISQVVTAADGDFALTSIYPLTARTGLPASGLLAVTSTSDFHAPVAFTCALPDLTTYTCTVAPTTVNLAANTYATSIITLSPTIPAVASNRRPTPARLTLPSSLQLASLLPLSLFSFAVFARRRRAYVRSLLCLAILTLAAFSTTACGPDIFVTATHPGIYPVVITATGTSPGEPAPITHTLTIDFTVTP